MMIKRENIHIRDPFILTDRASGCYYMYGTTGLLSAGIYHTETTFAVYKTRDLENFEEPKIIFDGAAAGFWGTQNYWAPEVHAFRGKYYMLASFKADGRPRATHILVSDTPDGTFVPVSDTPATPAEWECLDGTLWVEDGVPYLVFCHEWVQVGDGEIWAMALSDDLSHPAGEPFLLFRASDNPHVTPVIEGTEKYVTDGPFLYREGGRLHMIWSSFADGRYMVLEAHSDGLRSRWTHEGSRYDFDGGHAMLFERTDGVRMISLHAPNTAGEERPFFTEY